MKKYRISVIPGDGIGKEVIPASLKVLNSLSDKFGFHFDFVHYPFSCEYYRKHGRMISSDGLDRLADSDSIFLGAVGYPGVPDHVSLWGLLIPIRRHFEQYVNLRPVRLLEGITSPLTHPGNIDFYIVRENNEGEYSSVGGKLFEDSEREVVIQESIFTRQGVDRILRYAFDLAMKRSRTLTSATKSNGIMHTMPYWDLRVANMSNHYPSVSVEQFHIDILCAHFVQNPEQFDIVVASNLFGDILSDLGPAVVGGMGIAPGANLNPEKDHPSMFEPVHGSAPDIAGLDIANPIASFWTAQMMLAHLGEDAAAALLMSVIEENIADGTVKTRDLGGSASTSDVTMDIISRIADK
ncbi:MAG: tartrate dehydrogenase [Saprospiraceae bacterium]|nr:tartrate dehydrogenase [Saprospiraceae bacterium]